MDDEKQNEQENMPTNLEICEKLRDEYLAGWQRAVADLANYKKNEGERLAWLKKQIDQDWLFKILDFCDDLERAQNHIPENLQNENWLKGIFLASSKFLEELKKQGLTEIKAVGEKFNPEFHEALTEIKGEGESGVVAEVIQKGYLLNGELLRPSKVKIIK
ncbi:MAG: nucleotide exchange factor GrpE [Candidatus Gribaldobacteria bacterium]|nr:nucleotide exchange factor GrpE [Candidatus Gribaldobacteria bacterium]